MSSKNIVGVTDAKKGEIKTLESKVLTAQGTVEKLQAIVTSLTEKYEKIEAALTSRDANKARALSTKKLFDTVLHQVKELCDTSTIVASQIDDSNVKIKRVAVDITTLMNKLIYTGEVVNKLSNLVVRKKAMNPLISDELVEMLSKAGADANNAVALTLIALESVFASQTITMESEATIVLENTQVAQLYAVMTQESTSCEGEAPQKNMKQLVDQMYEDSLALYTSTLEASDDVAKQLHSASADLDKAKMNLGSLQAGLAAANAAAFAS